jgi:hypothetical protein
MAQDSKETEAFGADSFLDVVSNVVGMLIILVVMVGIRAGRAGMFADEAYVAETEAVASLRSENEAAEAEVLRLGEEMRRVAMQGEALSRERDAIAVMVAAAQKIMDEKQRELDARSQADYGRRREVSEATQRLKAMEEELAAPVTRGPVVQLTSYQTPISKSVTGKELQFQLRAGRITMIPIEELLERFKSDAQAKSYHLRNQYEYSDSIGPVGGFRMQYTLERIDASVEDQVRLGKGMSVVQLAEYTLMPESALLGETLEEAMQSRSQFRADLTPFKPADTTITLWTYEDSFQQYRAVKEVLHNLGYKVAGRPMPHGQPIGGSPHGSRSAAQ